MADRISQIARQLNYPKGLLVVQVAILNVSSTSGVHGNARQANYSLAKAGVTGLSKTVAKEWGPMFGVGANTIALAISRRA